MVVIFVLVFAAGFFAGAIYVICWDAPREAAASFDAHADSALDVANGGASA